ncbi:TonB-dependent receptor domain-containing protein [Actinobacillus capsulatus]|uniref:TonB-dependent receptor domain-containing protein n=1 Tax=Actinobacillus capsulatus TaxID=717 RepID=UPI000372FD5F|nr:TonB-dependent receptor [Actinobacillus capsulatus]
MFNKSYLAIFVATLCANVSAEQQSTQLGEVSVVAQADKSSSQVITQQQIQRQQAGDIKDLFANSLDVSVSDLQSSRSGNQGVNVRGLQDNRVETTIDGIELPEAQEAKHFISYGMEFGRGDYVEPTALRSATVDYVGSERALSSSVNFNTLTPQDVLKGRVSGGFVGTGYDSKDNSGYLTAAGAVAVAGYQGMVMSTVRSGDETENQGTVGGTGDSRTKANPADSKNVYVLTKHAYQINDRHQLKFDFESQSKKTETDLLSKDGTRIDARTGTQTSGNSTDSVKRHRFSLGHEYHAQEGAVQKATTHVYFQNARTHNDRLRQSASNYRHETSESKTKSWGFTSDLISVIESAIPQVLRYGASYSRTDLDNYLYLDRPAYGAVANKKPTANATQDKATLYVEDQIALGDVVITPHLGVAHYRVNPSMEGHYSQAGSRDVAVSKQHETKFIPKLGLEWKIAAQFEPFFQYSRGVRTPSSQQLTSSFGETVQYYIPGRGMQTVEIAVVGNPNLKSETANNFELGFKGQTETLQYRVAGYYNRYKNFIDWRDLTSQMSGYTQFLQYQNSDKAKIYGLTAQAKWHFYEDFYSTAGIAYARGSAKNDGVKTPINSIQPLKAQLGLGYEGEFYGADVRWTYTRGKADKDINGSMYNPTGGYSLVDLGFYWKPVKSLTLTANINNLFDKKYWNWNDISYLALLKGEATTAGSPPIGIDAANADRYTAPGRHFNLGVRYEF